MAPSCYRCGLPHNRKFFNVKVLLLNNESPYLKSNIVHKKSRRFDPPPPLTRFGISLACRNKGNVPAKAMLRPGQCSGSESYGPIILFVRVRIKI
jgi:hypothetical protein